MMQKVCGTSNFEFRQGYAQLVLQPVAAAKRASASDGWRIGVAQAIRRVAIARVHLFGFGEP